MKYTQRFLILLSALFVAGSALASDLTIVVRNHQTLISEGGKRQLNSAVFTDEALVVDVQLDVFTIPQMPSTAAHLAELRTLTTANWLNAIEWKLTKSDGTHTPLTAKLVTGNVRRDRGPHAAAEADRDASVACTTFKAALNFGALSPGDYALDGNVDGVSSHFNFVVRTGNEPAWRDIYLRDKAARAKSYAEFRAIELQRLEANPDRLDVLMDLLDRSLQAGTLDESRGYVQRAKDTVKRREQSASAESRQALADAVPYLDSVATELPNYFAHRDHLTMTRNVTSGKYEIRDRHNGDLVRVVDSKRD